MFNKHTTIENEKLDERNEQKKFENGWAHSGEGRVETKGGKTGEERSFITGKKVTGGLDQIHGEEKINLKPGRVTR